MEEELKSMKMTIFKLKVTRDGRKLRFHLQGQKSEFLLQAPFYFKEARREDKHFLKPELLLLIYYCSQFYFMSLKGFLIPFQQWGECSSHQASNNSLIAHTEDKLSS